MKKILFVIIFLISIKCFAQVSYVNNPNGSYVAFGLSSDTKPDLPPDNCVFVEMNTGTIYVSASSTWAVASSFSSRITATGSAALTNKTIATFNYAADAGANDSYVISLSPAPAAYTTGMIVFFKANTANTTGCTINVNGLGVKNILKRVSTTPATGDILQGMLCMILYDGASFILLNPVVN